MENRSLVDHEVMADHLSSFEVSVGRLIVNHSIHNEAHILWLTANFGDSLTFRIPFRLQLLKILGVKVVVSVLQESVNFDCILVQELGQLCLQSAWKNLEQVRHLLVVFDLTLRVEVLKVVLKLVDQLRTNVEFLIELFDLLHSFLIVGVGLGNLHELRGQIGENI